MVRAAFLIWVMWSAWATLASAEGYQSLGYGRIVNNDLLGDGGDRWQTGSITTSRVFGPGWHGILPSKPFELLEFRISGQVIAPADIRISDPGDRPFAGALSFGLHTHFQRGPVEVALGGDLVFTGPQTGLSDLQTALHDTLNVPPASRSVLSRQIANGFHPTLVSEFATPFSFGSETTVRPFVETRWGIETLARVGVDVMIGTVGTDELLIRDPVTGQRYRATESSPAGRSYVFGGDVAYVDSSAFLPSNQGFKLPPTRTRLRAGIHWQGFHNSLFIGTTYLSKEFKAQPKGQFVGSARIKIEF